MAGNIVKGNEEISMYPGGKGNCYQKLINLIPPHKVYIEPFAGFAYVARNKQPARTNILVDMSGEAIVELRCSIGDNSDVAWHFIRGCALSFLAGHSFVGTVF